MHTYEPLWTDYEADDLPSMADYRFRDALDVVEYAQRMCIIGRATWPEVWHLNGEGLFQCGFKASSLDSIRGWAADPDDLSISRQQGLASGGCANRWVVVESRQRGHLGHPIVDERDAEAFLRLRRHVERIDPVLELVDAMVFDDEFHWWSLHELTSGSTRWSEPKTSAGVEGALRSVQCHDRNVVADARDVDERHVRLSGR